MRPTSITDVQVLLGDLKLTKLLIWEEQNNIVIAKPKRRLSPTVFSEILRKFQHMGGRYESYVGFIIELEAKP